ncbi:MAG: S-layer homology domain-containing protein [Oscillospiraceae bacterium]|nr:S-layer homology domain-containing protein [Oscillospiraceae bacterium]
MKTFTRILCLLLCLVLTAGFFPAAAEEPVYVALGDSIADGYRLAGYTAPGSAPAESFPVLLANAMEARLIPLAVSGMDTDGLLRALDTQTYRSAVAKADTITLTIGSNDLLHPAIDRLTSLGQSVAEGDLSGLLTDLTGAGNVLTSAEAQEEYARHVTRFRDNWEAIISRIRALNPTAEIYVTNFYNPYGMLEYTLGFFSLHVGSVAQTYLDQMNAWLEESPSAGEYRIADIRDVSTNVCFSPRDLTGFDLDPHPDPAGHALIFRRLLSVRQVAEAEARYPDFPREAWAREAIGGVTALGLMQGMEDGRFDPEGLLTIAQVLALAARLHSLRHGGTAQFDQSYGSRWYDVYYKYCTDNGLIGKRDFRDLNQPATRAQAARVLAHALETEELPALRDVRQIPDVARGDYAGEEIYLLYRAGVLNGMNEAGDFYPQNNLRRSEAAAILLRLADADMRIK